MLIGIAQEKANVFRPPSKKQREKGMFAAGRNSAFVKHFYLYVFDREFRPTLIKFCTYARSA